MQCRKNFGVNVPEITIGLQLSHKVLWRRLVNMTFLAFLGLIHTGIRYRVKGTIGKGGRGGERAMHSNVSHHEVVSR
jgi:hypothetical protein